LILFCHQSHLLKDTLTLLLSWIAIQAVRHEDHRWLYGMKTKDDMLKVIKKLYSDIADIIVFVRNMIWLW
jgi:hypothetical protein